MKAIWMLIYAGVLVWSGIHPKGYPIWFLEVVPAIAGAVVLATTYKRFRLTTLVYALILIHCIILMVGGHYTYAEVPLFDRISEIFNWPRNNYDKVGHFAQGFVPAMIAREILIRRSVVNGQGWLKFIVVSICLAISAFYELIEWWVAIISDEAADAFLGTQGYVWDTQSDMGLALAGSILALLLLGKRHDRQLRRLGYEK